ncbi:hypothetical protein [Aestuariivirga sp.]|uniref:hypothetical protein n=1 Tax=Aestuariivirga sp. TaxID=2650926 RepID=UPI0039E5FB33
MRKIALVIGAVIFTASLEIMSRTSFAAQCLDGREAALRAGGFSGLISCDENASFNPIGTIHTGMQDFLVCDYTYRFMPEDGSVMHGQQRVVIFNMQGGYVGQYSLTPPPKRDVRIDGATLIISADGNTLGVIDFRTGPSPSALVDGEVISFFR